MKVTPRRCQRNYTLKLRLKKINSNGWTNCIFGEEINHKECDMFNIYIQWKTCIRSFFIGYITSTINKSIIDWNQWLGNRSNSTYSNGILINKHYTNFYIWNYKHYCKELSYKSLDQFKQNDIFILSFNFIQDTVTIYHNIKSKENCAQISLRGCKSIIPAFSLCSKGEEIEIIHFDLLHE